MQIETQLKELRLHGMSRSWQILQETRRHHELSLSEGLELLLGAEQDERSGKRFDRLLKNAGFRYKASIEELNTDPSRGVDRSLITELSLGNYLARGEAVLISGASGAGKSFLASALGHQACAQGYRVAYYNLQKLLLRTKMSRIDGSIYKLMERLSKIELLILDDFCKFRRKSTTVPSERVPFISGEKRSPAEQCNSSKLIVFSFPQ